MSEKALRLYNTITDIDDELIEEADKPYKRKRTPLFRALLIAAVIAALSVTGLSVFAAVNHIDISYSIVKKIEGEDAQMEGFLEKLEHTQAQGYKLKGTQIYKRIEEKGVSPVTLPAIFGESDMKIEFVEIQGDDISEWVKDAYFSFNYGNITGSVNIEQYSEPPEDSAVSSESFSNVENGKIISANGMDVIVMGDEEVCFILYRDGNTVYRIVLEGTSYEEALKIAESIA